MTATTIITKEDLRTVGYCALFALSAAVIGKQVKIQANEWTKHVLNYDMNKETILETPANDSGKKKVIPFVDGRTTRL